MITAKSYFSGAGGMDLGLIEAGIKIVESFEIDKNCCETLSANFSHKINQTDISKITVLDQMNADVYIGAFPCTKYSPAADIHKTRTGDDLFLHFFRHVALTKPEAFVVENVPGMKKFKVVMETLTKLPDYYVKIACPVDAQIWLPQKRPRLIIIGTKKPFKNYKEPRCNNPLKLKDIIEENPDIEIPSYVYKRLTGGYRDLPIISDPDKNDIAPTAVAHYSKDVSTRLIKDCRYPYEARPYSVKEYQRLQGFPDWFKFCGSKSSMYSQIGNAVAVPVAKWIGEQLQEYFKEIKNGLYN